jgi:hypothetical protein
MASEQAVARCFAVLCAEYRDQADKHFGTDGALTQAMEAFAPFFEDTPDYLLEAAVAQHVATSRWWPKVSDVRSIVLDLVSRADDRPNAYDAWEEALRHFRPGHSKDRWTDPRIPKALDGIGGLHRLGQADNSELASWRSRFVECFNLIVARERKRLERLPQVEAALKQLESELPAMLEEDADGL